jgi:hypothetical protein
MSLPLNCCWLDVARRNGFLQHIQSMLNWIEIRTLANPCGL